MSRAQLKFFGVAPPEPERLGVRERGVAMTKTNKKAQAQHREAVSQLHPVLRTVHVGSVAVEARGVERWCSVAGR